MSRWRSGWVERWTGRWKDGWMGGVDGWNADWLVYGMICLKSFPNTRIFQKPLILLSPLVQSGARVGCGEVLQVNLCRRIGVSWTRTYWQGGAHAHILTAGRKPGS